MFLPDWMEFQSHPWWAIAFSAFERVFCEQETFSTLCRCKRCVIFPTKDNSKSNIRSPCSIHHVVFLAPLCMKEGAQCLSLESDERWLLFWELGLLAFSPWLTTDFLFIHTSLKSCLPEFSERCAGLVYRTIWSALFRNTRANTRHSLPLQWLCSYYQAFS